MTFCSCWHSPPRQMAPSQQPACQTHAHVRARTPPPNPSYTAPHPLTGWEKQTSSTRGGRGLSSGQRVPAPAITWDILAYNLPELNITPSRDLGRNYRRTSSADGEAAANLSHHNNFPTGGNICAAFPFVLLFRV